MSRKIRSVVLVLILVNLFASAVHALPPSHRHGGIGHGDTLTAVWGWLGSLLIPALEKPGPQEGWRKAGSQMDPNGFPQESAFVSGRMGEAGSQVDLDGNK